MGVQKKLPKKVVSVKIIQIKICLEKWAIGKKRKGLEENASKKGMVKKTLKK